MLRLSKRRGSIRNFAKAFAKRPTLDPCAILSAEVTGMSAEEPKAVVELVGDDLFYECTPSGHMVAIDTDHERNLTPESNGTPTSRVRILHGSGRGFHSQEKA